MTWRLAKSLEVLRTQIDNLFPGRDKSWDGTIGDAAHAARKSDHNPNESGVVQAMDITRDDDVIDMDYFLDNLRLSKDPRIKYIIFNRRISNPSIQGGVWRPYTGSSPHDHHFHISVVDDPKLYDSTSPWAVAGGLASVTPATESGPPAIIFILAVGAAVGFVVLKFLGIL